jgi:hypothetical protein
LRNGKVLFQGAYGGVRNIWQVAMDERTWTLRGALEHVTAGPGEFPGAASLDGVIPIATGSGDISIYSLAINSEQAKVSGSLIPVVRDGSNATYPTLTRDGSKMVYVSNRLGTQDIRIRDLSSGADTPLVVTSAQEHRALISQDGSQLAFVSLENGAPQPYLWPMPSGPEQRLCAHCGPLVNVNILNWAPDGKFIVMAEGEPQRHVGLDVATGQRKPLVEHSKYPIHDSQVSLDGKWIVFKLVTSTTVQPLFVAPVRGGGAAPKQEWIKLTRDFRSCQTLLVARRRFDLLLYYSTEDTYLCLYARRIDPLTKQPQGPPLPVRHLHDDLRVANAGYIGYGLAPDGLYVPLKTRRSDIWLAEPEKTGQK